MMNRFSLVFISFLFSLGFFAIFAQEIEVVNTKIRTFISKGEFTKFKFSPDGIPSQISARLGNYTSPFYVVHFGMLYSETCRSPTYSDKYHWIFDGTSKFWPGKPESQSLSSFRQTLDWLVSETKFDDFGNAHFEYDFFWPYRGYPGGGLQPGWWSGLTDGYAIVLLLRGYDCFNQVEYKQLAKQLYSSVTTPVEQGGSLIYWDGHPWIEEYVDPAAPSEALSRVFNGMAYAYFGVKSYEDFSSKPKFASALLRSMQSHVGKYDLGYWSAYDAVGGRSNVKYHNVNWSLISDPRLKGVAKESLINRWSFGSTFPVFYLLQGPVTFALIHAWLTILALTLIFFHSSKAVYSILKRIL